MIRVALHQLVGVGRDNPHYFGGSPQTEAPKAISATGVSSGLAVRQEDEQVEGIRRGVFL